jgi:prophage tail gpP-like protein
LATADTGLAVRFEQSDRTETRIEEWSIDSSYLVSTDGFSFTLYSEKRDELRDLELQPVELTVNGASQCLGRIEVTETGGNGSSVTCQGRDYISELVECNIDPFKIVKADTELGDALLDVMRPVGITGVTDFENIIMAEVRSGVSIKSGKKRKNRRKTKVEEFKPKPGEGIYEFCNRLVARHGATIQPALTRSEVVLDAPDYEQTPLYRLFRTDDQAERVKNNIVSATARRDFSNFPTYSVFTGTAAKSGKQQTGVGFQFDMLDFVNSLGNDELIRIMSGTLQPGRSRDGDANALYRLLYHRDEDSRTNEQLELAAHRAISERLKNTLAYTCTVNGHVDPESGAVWAINTMAEVSDAVTGVHEKLWIARRTLRYSSEGATTELEMWRPGSVTIGNEE